MIKNCLICFNAFKTKKSRIEIGKGKFCSRKCYELSKRKRIFMICKNCGAEFFTYPCYIRRDGHRYFCSSKCYKIKKIIKSRKSSDGYICLHEPSHPNKDYSGRVREHRIIIEKHIGRLLDKKEVVHHVNHNKSDNRVENLMVFSSAISHSKFHKAPHKVKPEEIIFDGRKH